MPVAEELWVVQTTTGVELKPKGNDAAGSQGDDAAGSLFFHTADDFQRSAADDFRNAISDRSRPTLSKKASSDRFRPCRLQRSVFAFVHAVFSDP